jgi:hypothetical protein
MYYVDAKVKEIMFNNITASGDANLGNYALAMSPLNKLSEIQVDANQLNSFEFVSLLTYNWGYYTGGTCTVQMDCAP